MSQKEFVKYVLGFYGKGGIYAFRPVMRHGEAVYAYGILTQASAAGDHDFDGDTWDRELARDIVLLMRKKHVSSDQKAHELFMKYAHKRWK
jgi:hypothetical protein